MSFIGPTFLLFMLRLSDEKDFFADKTWFSLKMPYKTVM